MPDGNVRHECTAFSSRGPQRAPRSGDGGPDRKNHLLPPQNRFARQRGCGLGPGPSSWARAGPHRPPHPQLSGKTSLPHKRQALRDSTGTSVDGVDLVKFWCSFPGLALSPGKSACLRMYSGNTMPQVFIPITVLQQMDKKRVWKHAERRLLLSKCFSLLISKIGIMPVSCDYTSSTVPDLHM